MTFTPKEIIIGASIPLAAGSNVTLSLAGHIEREEDITDAVTIYSRKLLKLTNSASDEDRLTVRQVVSSITSTPLDKVPDVGAATPAPEPAKTSPSVTLDQVSPLPERMPAPTPAEQAAAAVRTCIKPPAAPPKSEASDPYDIVICEGCGAETTRSQAKLSQLFMSKTLCKACMDQNGGV
ncbi:MAG: hypothetical protein WC277_06145 [Bacilli bacterium]